MLRPIAGLLILCLASDTAFAQPVEQPPSPAELQSRVIQDLLAQPIGNHTLQVHNLPDDYVQRVADRFIRASYESQFRIVVRETKPGINPPATGSDSPDLPSGEPPRSNRALSLIPIWVAIAIILISGLILARRGKGA